MSNFTDTFSLRKVLQVAGDNRDWYRDWWNKKTGYVERSLFRMSEGEKVRHKFRAGWRRNFLAVGAAAALVALLAIARSKRKH